MQTPNDMAAELPKVPPAALAGTVMVMSLACWRLGTTAAMYSVPCCVSSTALTLPASKLHGQTRACAGRHRTLPVMEQSAVGVVSVLASLRR